MARDYWALKKLGTVRDLCEKYGVSLPTLLKYAREFRPTSAPLGKSDPGGDGSDDATAGAVTPPSVHDASPDRQQEAS